MALPGFDWFEQCPFCDKEFAGYTGYRDSLSPIPYDYYQAGMNPFLALLEHVPKEHPERLIPCSDKTPAAFWRKDRTCSHCGGLDPEVALANIEAGHAVTPTDKSYKIYVDPGDRKAYFYHFSETQLRRFTDLYNQKRMKLGSPGYFYARPYFWVGPEAKRDS